MSENKNIDLRKEEFWALKDVSFNINQGEVIGLIGRNGAGKTTLLKILSRVTPPTDGEVILRGRIASLLEVRTGFHPELTGRENIFLYGVILGMTKREIKKRFEEIVGFAEIEQFLDTPVKYYSSGMYVRLAFSVATHLNPEILVVDEVLSVGDISFQRKSLGKMQRITREGRTIIFVSHNMSAIFNLCSKCILLDKGRIVKIGSVAKVIDRYLKIRETDFPFGMLNFQNREGSGKIQFKELSVTDAQGNKILSPNKPVILKMRLGSVFSKVLSSRLIVAIGISNNLGERLIELHTGFDKSFITKERVFGKNFTLTCKIPKFPLKSGVYFLTLYASYADNLCDRIKDAYKIEVQDVDYFGTGQALSQTQGWFMLKQSWQ